MSSTQHRCVFVGNIPYDATEDQLIRICEEVGPVVSFRLVLDRETGKPKGYGFCEYRDEETASSARRNLQGYEINGRQLRVDFAENEKGSVDRNREQGRGGPGLAQNIDVHKQTSGPKAARDPSVDQPIGLAAAASAAVVMAGILGGPQVSNSQVGGQLNSGGPVGTDALTNHLAGMSRHELYSIIAQMKNLIQQNQQQARQILIANPQLTKALFQAQIILGMIRAPQTLPQTVAAQAPQQQPAQQFQMQPVQPPQIQNMPHLPAMQQMPLQQGHPPMPQQGHLQMPTGQLQPQLQGVQQSQALNVPLQPHQPSQNPQFHHQATSVGLQPESPARQHSHPQMPLHMHLPPLPQQPRPLVPPSQLQPLSAQGMSFQPPPGPQSQLPQVPFQQPTGVSQTNMGMPYQQMHLPFPTQPPSQQGLQMPRNGPDIGGSSGIVQNAMASAVSTSLGGSSHAVRGPSMGASSGSSLAMTWDQLPSASGSMVGAPQETSSTHMSIQVGTSRSLGDGSGIKTSLSGGFSSNGAARTQEGAIRANIPIEETGLLYSQGYAQLQTQSQPQQQSQQQPQVQAPLELEQQKALLQQVMNLTSEQINALPPEQRQQVLQLQQAFRSQSI